MESHTPKPKRILRLRVGKYLYGVPTPKGDHAPGYTEEQAALREKLEIEAMHRVVAEKERAKEGSDTG